MKTGGIVGQIMHHRTTTEDKPVEGKVFPARHAVSRRYLEQSIDSLTENPFHDTSKHKAEAADEVVGAAGKQSQQ